MKTRKRLFYILAVLTIILMFAWIAAGTEAVEESKDDLATELERDAADVGGGLGITIIFCLMTPIALFFALLGWRNGAGIRTERRHQEQLAMQAAALRQTPTPT